MIAWVKLQLAGLLARVTWDAEHQARAEAEWKRDLEDER